VSRVKTAHERQEYLDAYKASGESVKRWCEQNGMHRTTVYRWLRQDTLSKSANAKTTLEKAEPKPSRSTQVSWLPVTKKSSAENTESKKFEIYQSTPAPVVPANTEIRVQIGSFIIVTPDGFRRETLESVCQTLRSI